MNKEEEMRLIFSCLPVEKQEYIYNLAIIQILLENSSTKQCSPQQKINFAANVDGIY